MKMMGWAEFIAPLKIIAPMWRAHTEKRVGARRCDYWLPIHHHNMHITPRGRIHDIADRVDTRL